MNLGQGNFVIDNQNLIGARIILTWKIENTRIWTVLGILLADTNMVETGINLWSSRWSSKHYFQ